jgi:holo-[acyl-carrier protein] synthase
MIIGTGIDLVEISRIRKTLLRNGSALKRFFTTQEIKYSKQKHNSYESFAARFAAKEAFMKAVGTGWGTKQSPKWNEIEIINRDNKPLLKLYGKAKIIAKKIGVKNMHISLSHTKEYALAMVVLED